MKLPTNAAEWDKECERIVRAMQAYAAPYITPISKIISDDEGELLGTGSYVEMIGRRLLPALVQTAPAGHIRRPSRRYEEGRPDAEHG